MKTLGLLFTGVFLGAVAYEVAQRSYPGKVEEIRDKIAEMVDKYKTTGTGNEEARE
ncbi:hypothetical protein EPICR_30023 [Candidatus Desulfarcum epimagneticum]|uniref:Uncharacterized protein n=1 Tax=uncultured Desulfobacteraceae bacterium TaxID=218296 RepID=A0A484HI02_9BACT|nr:hypothetical protein EPICR_30023 [uncultured Desulfobacteraceae bacterium]